MWLNKWNIGKINERESNFRSLVWLMKNYSHNINIIINMIIIIIIHFVMINTLLKVHGENLVTFITVYHKTITEKDLKNETVNCTGIRHGQN